MKNLTEADVIRTMREEWNRRMAALSEKVDIVMNAKIDGGDEKPVLSPGLKVVHTKSGIRYTIDSVGPRDLILKTPEGEQFVVDAQEAEADYRLD